LSERFGFRDVLVVANQNVLGERVPIQGKDQTINKRNHVATSILNLEETTTNNFRHFKDNKPIGSMYGKISLHSPNGREISFLFKRKRKRK